MEIKHYSGGKWIVDGASNASSIELTNPGFLSESGESISVNNGFTKIDNRLSKLERNIAWIYQNGAKGGSGSGGSGGTSTDYTFQLISDSTLYTTTGSVDISFIIQSGGTKKNFKVSVRDTTSGKYYVSSVTKSSMV
jgi:hypothetical protein